ncbi:MAG: hypothetical protein HON94_04910 [Methylococcales bacterium]|jgi:hypothetical protein|nr:hypothetical protein [Methylococcales bacterium]MBT7410677.1 hypothetical protein [Methylococcales bacterium]
MLKIIQITIAIYLFMLLQTAISSSTPKLQDLSNILQYKLLKNELEDKLYPIGFSKKGLFAYIEIAADEAVGCYLWSFHILNLVNDKNIYTLDWKQQEEECLDYNFKHLIEKYGSNIQQALNKYAIDGSKIQLESFPFDYNNHLINATLVISQGDKFRSSRPNFNPTPKKSDWAIETVYQVVIHKSITQLKTIGKIIEKKDNSHCFICQSNITGYIKSPYENRIIVIIEQQARGWEGPPNVSTFKLFGASLTAGFKAELSSSPAQMKLIPLRDKKEK